MNNLKKEYTEFGPWLSEIINDEDITHQFIHLKKEILTADFAVKVPVDKEWRNVKEGELLYDAVIAIDEVSVAYHKIIDGVAYSCKMDLRDVDYIRLNKDMLTYKLEIGTSLECLHILYEPLPNQLANRFIHILLDRFVNANEHINKMLLKKVSLYYKDSVKISGNTIEEHLITS